jgi:hypothetical protein
MPLSAVTCSYDPDLLGNIFARHAVKHAARQIVTKRER